MHDKLLSKNKKLLKVNALNYLRINNFQKLFYFFLIFFLYLKDFI